MDLLPFHSIRRLCTRIKNKRISETIGSGGIGVDNVEKERESGVWITCAGIGLDEGVVGEGIGEEVGFNEV